MAGESRRVFSLTGDTLIPLSLAGSLLAAGVWLNSIDSRIHITEKRLDDFDPYQAKVQEHLEAQTNALGEIKAQVAAVDARLEMLLRIEKKRDE